MKQKQGLEQSESVVLKKWPDLQWKIPSLRKFASSHCTIDSSDHRRSKNLFSLWILNPPSNPSLPIYRLQPKLWKMIKRLNRQGRIIGFQWVISHGNKITKLMAKKGTTFQSFTTSPSFETAQRPVSYTHLDVYKRQHPFFLGLSAHHPTLLS